MPELSSIPTLVVQTAFLGDVVLTTPLLSALAERHGPVDVVTTPAAVPLLETHPAVRQVIPYAKRGADAGVSGFLRLVRRLRAEAYPIAYLPHRSLRSAALAVFAGIPRRIGYASGWRLLYTGSRLRPASGHEIDRLLALADVTPRHQTMPTLGLTASDVAAAEAALRAAAIAPPFVALAPGSIWGSKRWPHFAGLAARMVPRLDVAVVGGSEDAGLGNEITAAVAHAGGRSVNLCGRMTLRQSAALIQKASVLVTNDSAPLHFAQAVGTPTVAIFGSTVPAFGFGPRGPRDRTVGVDDLRCRPCSAHGPARCPLGHHLCMRSITVENVMQAIEETGALHRRD
jgi:heptosyltransferase-2